MLKSLGSILCWLGACGTVLAGSEASPNQLRILYAGNPGSDRERDYVGFLKETFAKVDTVDYQTFREEMAEGHDVVIFDWTSLYPRDAAGRQLSISSSNFRMNYPKSIPHLSEGYSRPTILIGGAGQRAIQPLRLKIDWGCLCLWDHAHGMKIEHPIFHRPFPVNMQIEEIPTPAEYKLTPDSGSVGPTIQVWRIQKRRYYDADPGLVSRGGEFEEAPDAEVISSGVNGKTPRWWPLGATEITFFGAFPPPRAK